MDGLRVFIYIYLPAHISVSKICFTTASSTTGRGLVGSDERFARVVGVEFWDNALTFLLSMERTPLSLPVWPCPLKGFQNETDCLLAGTLDSWGDVFFKDRCEKYPYIFRNESLSPGCRCLPQPGQGQMKFRFTWRCSTLTFQHHRGLFYFIWSGGAWQHCLTYPSMSGSTFTRQPWNCWTIGM